jgi:hypothetical protein
LEQQETQARGLGRRAVYEQSPLQVSSGGARTKEGVTGWMELSGDHWVVKMKKEKEEEEGGGGGGGRRRRRDNEKEGKERIVASIY